MQIDTMRAPGRMYAQADAMAAGSSLATSEGSTGGISTVSAVARTSGPCSTVTEKPVLLLTSSPSTVYFLTAKRRAEDPTWDAQFERVHPVKRQDDDTVRTLHGKILPKDGNPAMAERDHPVQT